MVFVDGVTIVRLGRQGPCLGAGQYRGSRAGAVTPPAQVPTEALAHTMASPAGTFAVVSAVLLLQISPWMALFDQHHLPSPCASQKPNEEEAGAMQCASCPPLLSSSGSGHVADETALLGQILFLEELPFLVAQWHGFQELCI